MGETAMRLGRITSRIESGEKRELVILKPSSHEAGFCLVTGQQLVHNLFGMQSVIPATESVVREEVELAHFCVSNFDPLVVGVGDQLGGDDEAGFRRGGADEIESLVNVGEGLASPVSADLAEQTVLDGIPLGNAWRVMADGDGETQRNADGFLDRLFPGAATGAIASSAISQYEQFSGSRISLRALVKPPL
jgi:hypothetical protein